jgi:1-deoxy-D-xylulose-5-phosphate synthase
LLDGSLRFRPLMIPDTFTEHASQTDMYAAAGLDRTGIVAAALSALDPSAGKWDAVLGPDLATLR